MKVIIDRFEGDFAVVETSSQQLINMPRQLIPANAREGSIIIIELDEKETDDRHHRISNLMNDLWKD